MIVYKSAMTIWYQVNLDVEIHALHKESRQKPWGTQSPEQVENKVKFSISSVAQQHARHDGTGSDS